MELSDNASLIIPFKKVRIIPIKNYPGNLNMAIDHFFSKDISHIKEPVVRFYGWEPYCLSLGRHQDISELNFKKLKIDGFNVVRRPTGGSAIFHSEELTYSIVIPKDLMDHKELYLMIHKILYRVLTKMGYNVELQMQNDHINYLKNGDATFICFNRSAYTEIKYKNKKLVGSAQKIYPDTVLQHGSILIGSKQNKISEYFSRYNQVQENNLKYLDEYSISLDKINNKKTSADQLSAYIIEEINRQIEIYQKPLTDKEIISAKKYCGDFDVKNIN